MTWIHFAYGFFFFFICTPQTFDSIIYWYQSDDVVVRNIDKSVIANVDINNTNFTDIEHTRNPFDDILMLLPFCSSRIKSEMKQTTIIQLVLNIWDFSNGTVMMHSVLPTNCMEGQHATKKLMISINKKWFNTFSDFPFWIDDLVIGLLWLCQFIDFCEKKKLSQRIRKLNSSCL